MSKPTTAVPALASTEVVGDTLGDGEALDVWDWAATRARAGRDAMTGTTRAARKARERSARPDRGLITPFIYRSKAPYFNIWSRPSGSSGRIRPTMRRGSAVRWDRTAPMTPPSNDGCEQANASASRPAVVFQSSSKDGNVP